MIRAIIKRTSSPFVVLVLVTLLGALLGLLAAEAMLFYFKYY